MSLAHEALEYWKTMQRYRGSYSDLGKHHAAHVDIPTLYLRVTNHRIRNQLSQIMSQEGIQHDEDQSLDPSA